MATPAMVVTTQLTQKQTNTTTPSLEQRKLARFLRDLIHSHDEDRFHKALQIGADVHFSGLDDHDKYTHPHIFTAISVFNTWAFDTLLEKNIDIHKAEKGITPLFYATEIGSVYMLRTLLNKGADPLDYNNGTCLSLATETLRSGTLLESQSNPFLKTCWRYEDEPLSADNAILEKEISDFFYQKGAYAPSSEQAIPFVGRDKAIHAYFKGKQEILGLLLNKYHVSPIIPVAGTERSPLKVVRNPIEYAKTGVIRSDSKEELQYVGTEDGQESTLIFTMKFWNKRYTGSLPIVVHYDFKPMQKLIESAAAHLNPEAHAFAQSISTKMEQGIRATENRLDMHHSTVQGQLTAVQGKLLGVQSEAAHFTEEMKNVKDAVHYDERQEIAYFTSRLNGHANAQEAYKSFKIGLEAIHTSALAVKGGGVTVSDGPLALVASVLDMSTELVDMIPIVGSAASKLFGLASTVTKEMDSVKQTNLFENIAAMATSKEARKVFESVARKLTMAYFDQFERLATKQVAQGQMSVSKKLLQNAKGKTLNTKFISPAERVTAFAIIWMIDEVFNNAHMLDKEIAEIGLEAVLSNTVTQRKPPEKLTTFWGEITSKLGINEIPTQTTSGTISGETWRPADFWTVPGVVVQNSSDFQYFSGNNTNVAKFGWRSGSLEDVQALGLTPTTEAALLPQQLKVNFTSPTPVVCAYLSMPKPPAFNSNTGTNSTPSASSLAYQEIKPEGTTRSPSANANTCPAPVSLAPSAAKQANPTLSKRNKSPFARLRAAYSST